MNPNNTLILRPNKLKMILLFSVCLVGTIIGFYMTKEALLNEEINFFLNSLVLIFSAIGLLIAFVLNLPNSSYLKLSSEGFEICTMYRKFFTYWSDVEDFQVYTIITPNLRGPTVTQTMVGYNFTDDYKGRNERMDKNQNSFGIDAGFSDSYGKKPEELVKILNDWKNNRSHVST